MKFSEREGHKAISNIIQLDSINDLLRNSLWNVLAIYIWERKYFLSTDIYTFSKMLWFEYFKIPIDSRPNDGRQILYDIRKYFFSCEWFEVYDLIEYIISYEKNGKIIESLNEILEKEFAGYRIINDKFSKISSKEEFEILTEVLNDDRFLTVNLHISRALELLSDRKIPDYRNSIKESISAVENICKIITNNDTATLGEALKYLEKKKELHPALKEGFSKLYGYTNDADGIRHSLLEVTKLNSADAKYFLISCTSFINYLKTFM